MKALLMPYLARFISSDGLLTFRRSVHRLRRGSAPRLTVFLRVNDPYSFVLIQALHTFRDKYSVEIDYHFVARLQGDMYPDTAAWHKWALQDAQALCALYRFPLPRQFPAPLDLRQLQQQAAYLENIKAPLHHVRNLFLAAFGGSEFLSEKQEFEPLFRANEQRLKKMGHYLTGNIYCEGEWYWGVDRLGFLEQRLIDEGFASGTPFFVKTLCNQKQWPGPVSLSRKPLIMYFSMRSPYSYLGLVLARRLCATAQIPLEVRPVMPMVMRGMQVPDNKKMYIFSDTKRLANYYRIPYGFVADPLGTGVERCYALYEWAKSKGKGIRFLTAFAHGVNAEGIRAETDKGLQRILHTAALDWDEAQQQLHNKQWQNWAQVNLESLQKLGFWGVPCFQYGNLAVWGHDRLWLIAEKIKLDEMQAQQQQAENSAAE